MSLKNVRKLEPIVRVLPDGTLVIQPQNGRPVRFAAAVEFADGSRMSGAPPPAPAPYLVYAALLTQSGASAPAAAVLESTLGGTPVWARLGAGWYRATLAGAFPAGKTAVCGPTQPIDTHMALQRIDADSVDLMAQAFDGTAYDGLSGVYVEIRVYR